MERDEKDGRDRKDEGFSLVACLGWKLGWMTFMVGIGVVETEVSPGRRASGVCGEFGARFFLISGVELRALAGSRFLAWIGWRWSNLGKRVGFN